MTAKARPFAGAPLGSRRLVPDVPAILAALPEPVLAVDGGDRVDYANAAAEQFFETSAANLLGASLVQLLPADSPIFALMAGVRHSGHSVSEYDVSIETPRLGSRVATIKVAPLVEGGERLVVALQERSMAHKIDRQLTHRNAARSVTAMAAMLAHEVKNPLSGIRGAAQLLEENALPGDRELTRLICDEADRIVALVDRMEIFSDRRPLERGPLNIHEVLDRVRLLARSGFARHVHFVDAYDPSLPPVLGNRDALIQAFLNLVKNAAEAVPAQGGEIQVATAFRHGVRLALPSSESRRELPLMVAITDNGEGIPDDLRPHLFDPFVSTKRNGTGLGLALVAKVIEDHGGVIEFDSQPRRTVFRVFLPLAGAESEA